MKQFGWSRIAVITQSENLFTFVCISVKCVYLIVMMYNLHLLLRCTRLSQGNINELDEFLAFVYNFLSVKLIQFIIKISTIKFCASYNYGKCTCIDF